MSPATRPAPRRLRIYTRRDIDRIPVLHHHLSPQDIVAMKAVSAVLPFRVNNHVVDELIDWRDVPDDPIYQLTFPQAEMLAEDDFRRMVAVTRNGASEDVVQAAAREIQSRLNPHPAVQSRDPAHTNRVFFARFDPQATWLDQLQPAFGEEEFFFEPDLRRMRAARRAPAWANGTKGDPVAFGHVEWE